MNVVMRGANGYDEKAASDEASVDFSLGGRTIQSQKDEADINVIVRRFGLTGQLPQVSAPPSYGDFSTVSDYQSAMFYLQAAQTSFAAMPAAVRARFNNDPAEFVAFCDNADNLEEARKLGIAIPAVPVVDPAKV